MVKLIKLDRYPQLPFTFIPETGIKKTILVYGDSFADAAKTYTLGVNYDTPVNNTINSWMWFLATFLQAKIITYGVSGGSEQLCYDLFKRTLDEPRDATIIYHTRLGRPDNFTEQPRLTYSDYVEWDKLTNDSTVHLYWNSEESIYKFKQGNSFHTKYHLTHCCRRDTIVSEDKDFRFDESLQNTSANHATQPGNLLLAIRLAQHFKNKLKWETIF